MRILRIEDDPGIVRVLERGLAAHGHQVVAADNGDDSILLASNSSVELVLLDISLPGPDGYAVLDHIRALRPTLPILMLTARDTLSNKVDALNARAGLVVQNLGVVAGFTGEALNTLFATFQAQAAELA
jgi:DNA-binding response OmpR family regulator